MKQNFLVGFLAFALAFSLTVCGTGQRSEPAPTPSAPAASPTPNAPVAETLEELLLNLTEDEIGFVNSFGPGGPIAAQTLAPLVRAAAEHTVDHAELTLNGSDTDIVWSLDLYMGARDQWAYSGEDSVYFYAGLEENIVEVNTGSNLPSGRLWLEDEALYQLLRTQNDADDGPIDRDAYDAYHETVDTFLNQPLKRGDISLIRELIRFKEVDEAPRLGAKLYLLNAVLHADPPEQAPHLISGGEYVDSRLCIHTYMTYLVVVDGEAVGCVGPFFDGYEGWLESFDTKEALIAQAKTGRGTGS